MPLQFTKVPRDSDLVSKITTKFPYYDKVQLIAPAGDYSKTPPSLRASFQEYETSNLYQLCLDSPKETFIKAIPQDQTSLAPIFQNSLTLSHGQVTLRLSQPSFQKCPNLQSRNKGKITKLKSEKIGHGGNYNAQYRYEIKTEVAVPELKTIISTVLPRVKVSIYSLDSDSQLPIAKSIAATPKVAHLDICDRYEALTIYANFDENQIVDANKLETQFATRFTISNTISSALSDLKWHLLSLHQGEHHILMQDCGDSIHVYEII
ncbi:uncharacterized protein LODBEIA_P61230 [Lodderomyces beijingensis]|uniref:Checkpoint protein n=1 Tax=Lodderomyces beijingensis TaxID=1775926 RepID=A0ABP0ZV79_9ASCO